MFNITGVHDLWFKDLLTKERAFVYDLDDTLLSRVGAKPHLLSLDKNQSGGDDCFILTYRPSEFNDETLQDIAPIKSKLCCLFTRDIKHYPFDKSDVDTFKYKFSVLSKLCSMYKKVIFFENKEVIVNGLVHSGLTNLQCYLVAIELKDGIEMIIKNKVRGKV